MNNKISKKGANMALPFIAGAALGALAVVAFNKREKIFDIAKDGFEKGKEAAEEGLEKGKKFADELIQTTKKRTRRTSEQIKADKEAKEAAKKPIKRTRKPAAKKQPTQPLTPAVEPIA